MRSYQSLPLAVRLVLLAAGLAALVAIPHALNDYWLYLLALVVVYSIANVGFQVVVGWTGILALAHAAFFGLGAYATAILPKLVEKPFYLDDGTELFEQVWAGRVPFLVALIAVPLFCAGLGYLLGLPAIRLKGFYLAIATLAFANVIVRVFFEAKDYTEGGEGTEVEIYRLWGWQKTLGTYYFALAIAVVIFALLGRLQRGRYGRTLLAVRDVDIAASSLGANVTQYRLSAFAMSAGIAALGGAMYGQLLSFITPNGFGTGLVNAMLIMIIVGGVGTRAGAVIGAAFFVMVDQFFVKFPAFERSALSGAYRNIAFGLALMLCIGVLPGGIASIPARLRALGRRREETQ